MDFDWDKAKNASNIRKHGIDFVDVRDMFSQPMRNRLDEREDYGERRWTGVGWLHGRLVVVVYAEPSPGIIRIISARKATSKERRVYERENVKN